MMKRLTSLILALALAFSMVPSAAAAGNEATKAAQALYDLGLFQGVGTNADGTPDFALDRTATRAEAVTMLVRLLGKDEEAKEGSWETPFTDVADWAKPYVGYAYVNGLTTGTGATAFGGDQTIDASQYLTFVLRALGYTSGTDFQWNQAWEKSDEIKLTNGQYGASTTHFTRGDVAVISKSALTAKAKGSNQNLLATLINVGAVSFDDAPSQLCDVWFEYVKYNGKVYRVFDSKGNRESFIKAMYDSYTSEVYFETSDFVDYGELVGRTFHTDQNQSNPYLDGRIMFSKEWDPQFQVSLTQEYLSATSPIEVLNLKYQGKSFISMGVQEQEVIEKTYEEGEGAHGVHNGIRFGYCYMAADHLGYNMNDLSDYFDLKYYYYDEFDSESREHYLVIEDRN